MTVKSCAFTATLLLYAGLRVLDAKYSPTLTVLNLAQVPLDCCTPGTTNGAPGNIISGYLSSSTNPQLLQGLS